MTVTYVGDLSTDRDKVRFYIQDTVTSSGPKPDGGNFTDAEIDGLLALEGSVGRAVAGAFEALAGIWRTRYSFTTEGQSFSRASVADGFASQAKEWRAKFGSTGTAATSTSLTRVDAYSDDIASDEA